MTSTGQIVRLPTNSNRTLIVGQTGSGKTQAGSWHLSIKNLHTFPWVVFDTKGDDLLREVSRMHQARVIDLKETPGRTGIFFVHAHPHQLQSELGEAFLWRIHARRRCGIFIDELYMFDRFSDALTALYTQGRSLNIPMISLSQKPKYVNQFAISESEFFQLFFLGDKKDRQRVNDFVPVDLERHLPPYHSTWYDVARRSAAEFSPVPARDRILENFAQQLRAQRRVI